MINDEFEIKINEIIKYLKENGGYNYKVYNQSCSVLNENPDSNIVEYAEDIRDYWLELTNRSTLYNRIILDINKIIYDNIKLFSHNDNKLVELKKYCKNNINKSIEHIDHDLLIKFVEETLIELLITECLYDFRNMN